MTASTTYRELVWLHKNSYGQTLKILRATYTALCIAIPFTNFTLPFVLPKILGLTFRW